MEKSKYDFLLGEIADSFESRFVDSLCYLNITRQEVLYIGDMSLEQDLFPTDGDELLNIESLPSFESFRIMEDFAESVRNEKQQERLFRMLGRSHPFSRFRDEVYDAGIEQEWFAYKNERMRGFAIKWLEENAVEYVEDHLVCKSHRCFVFNKEAYIEEYF